MTYDESKLKKVIDVFDGLALRNIDIYYPFVEKALSELLDLSQFTRYKNKIITVLLDTFHHVFSKDMHEPFSQTFRFVYNKKDGSIKFVDDKFKGKHKTIILNSEDLTSYILSKALWTLIGDDAKISKEIVALAVVSKLTQILKEDLSSDNINEDIDYDIGNIQDESDRQIKRDLEKHEPFIYQCIKYIYSREDLNFWKSSQFETLNQRVYKNLAESILSAEFFELDDYTDNINRVLRKHKNLNADDPESSIVPYTFYSLRNLFIHIIERCTVVKDMFDADNQSKEWIGVDSYPEQIIFTKTYIGYNETIYYNTLLRNICDLTDIDLTYVTSTDNIRTLIRVIRHSYFNVNESGSRKFDTEFSVLLNSIQVKASVLLHGMIHQPMLDSELEIKYIIGDKEIIEFVNQTCKTALSEIDKIHQNEYLHFWINHKGKNFSVEELRHSLFRDIDSFPPELSERKDNRHYNDIKLYNKFVKHSIGVDAKLSPAIKAINSHLNNGIDYGSFIGVAAKIEDSVNNSNTTSSFLYRAILFLFENKHWWRESLSQTGNDYSLLASKLLGKLRKYLDSYSSGVKPRFSFRPTFQFSFYTIQNGIIIFVPYRTPGSIFFASICFAPLNAYYLERFYTKYQTILANYNQDYFSSISAHIKEDVARDLHEKLVEERKGTIQILGIFAALLAFVSMSIGMFKMAETPLEFALYCCAFTSSLLLFVLAVRFVAAPKHEIGNKWGRDENKVLKILFPILIIGIIIALMIPFRGRKLNNDESIQNNTTILNQHSLKITHENPPTDTVKTIIPLSSTGANQ